MARIAATTMNILKKSISMVIPDKLVMDSIQRDGNVLKLGIVTLCSNTITCNQFFV